VLPGGWLTVAATAILCLAPIRVMIASRRGGAYPSAFRRIWLVRSFWYVQALIPLVSVAGLAGALAGLPFGASGRTGRWSLALGALSLVALGLVGYLNTRRLAVRRLEVRFDDLPAGLEGMRIAQLSDLHVGPHTSRRYLARVKAAVRDAQPDLIAFTGDQVDDYARDVEPFAEAFQGLSAPLGVFAIAGNHDVYAGWSEVRQGLEAMGLTVLVNRAVPLERGGSRFWLAGTGDPAGRPLARGGAGVAPDIDRTLSAVPPDEFTVALAKRGVELTLSGHTHYGQLAIPRLGWSLASPFLEHAMGEHRLDGSHLYINPGTNYWGIPFRLGTPPELTVLTLRRS
jgi:predicted MPP superfamily phosphohydrolase